MKIRDVELEVYETPRKSLKSRAIGRIKFPEGEWLYDVDISQKDFQICKEKNFIHSWSRYLDISVLSIML